MSMVATNGEVMKTTLTLREALTLMGVVCAIVLTLVGVIYNDATRRIEKVEDKMDSLAQAFNEFRLEVTKNDALSLNQ